MGERLAAADGPPDPVDWPSMGPLAILCPKCGFPTSPGPGGECRACGAVTPPSEWILLPEGSIPPVPGVGHPDPRVCPSCGSRLEWNPGSGPGLSPLVRFGAFFALLLLAAAAVQHGLPGPSGPPLLLGLILGGVLLGVFAKHDGSRFASEGAIACPGCRYVRLGRDESRELERARDRAVGALRRMLRLFVFPAAFLLAMCALQRVRGRSPGPYFALGLSFFPATILGLVLLRVFRPNPGAPASSFILRRPAAWESEWRRAQAPKADAARDREAT